MKTLHQSLLPALGALALAGTAFAQMPSTNDTTTTDNNLNTGGGTGALSSTTSTTTGNYNTAYGYSALHSVSGSGQHGSWGVCALYERWQFQYGHRGGGPCKQHKWEQQHRIRP